MPRYQDDSEYRQGSEPSAARHGASGRTKNLILRLDPGLAEQLQTVAQVEGRSVSDVAREAITRLVDSRRQDRRFLQLLEDNLARHERLISRLRDGEP
jgi:hypothetical protein